MEQTNKFFTIERKSNFNPVSRILYLPRGTKRLEILGETKIFPKNHVLAEQGELTNWAYVILQGKIAGYEYTSSGEERIFFINESDSVLLESNLLFDWVSPVEFKTLTQVEAVCISKTALMEAIYMDPDIAMDIIQSVSTKFMSAMEQVRYITNYNAEWRICDLLMIYADFYGVPYDGKILIQEKVSQQAISNLLGINRITAVRAIKDLKDMGLIEQINGLYCIRDMEKLKRHQARLA